MTQTQPENRPLSEFWMNWMTGYCVVVALFGIVLAGGAFEVTSDPVRTLLGLMNGTASGFSEPSRSAGA